MSKNSVGTFRGTEFDNSFMNWIKIRFEGHQWDIKHHEKFLKIRFWNFEAKKLMKNYYIELEEVVYNIINSFVNKNSDKIK